MSTPVRAHGERLLPLPSVQQPYPGKSYALAIEMPSWLHAEQNTDSTRSWTQLPTRVIQWYHFWSEFYETYTRNRQNCKIAGWGIFMFRWSRDRYVVSISSIYLIFLSYKMAWWLASGNYNASIKVLPSCRQMMGKKTKLEQNSCPRGGDLIKVCDREPKNYKKFNDKRRELV